MSEQAVGRTVRSERTIEQFSRVSGEFLRALRGAQSQSTMSRRLGFASNVFYQWESGRRVPSLTDAMRAAALVKRSEAGRRLAEKLQTPEGLCEMITEMTIGQSLLQLAEPLDVSRSALSRWRSGSSIPTFPKFLQLLDLCTGRMLEFLNMFVDPFELESVSEEWHAVSRFRALANLMPICIPTLCALDLDDYKALEAHDHRWLAARLGVSDEEMRFALDRIVEVGAIRFNGTHFVPNKESYDLFAASHELWTRLGLRPTTSGFYAGTASHQAVAA
jgi:transcriptional regulator with XRE-family HTH domain